MIKKLFTSRTGGLPILLFGFILILLLLVFLVIEMGGVYENYDYAEALLQRAANSAVESNMRDEYRADRILKLDAEGAESDFRSFVANDFPAKFSVTINELSAAEEPPALTASGTVTFSTIFSQYGFRDLTFNYHVRATNYDMH